MFYYSHSPEETKNIARSIAETAKAGSVFCLVGEMGAGKTVFAKGFARGLGVNEQVVSPTFCILNEYNGKLPFYHFDAYRINALDETDDVCYQDYFYGNGVCLIEWAGNIKKIIPPGSVWITIEKSENIEDLREIKVEGDKR